MLAPVLALGLLACGADPGHPGPAWTTLAQGEHAAEPPTAQTRLLVIDSTASLARHFRAMTGRSPPAVDFRRHRVLLLDAGRRPSAGHGIELVALERAEGMLVAEVRIRRPGADCLAAAVMTHPYRFVLVPATGGPVRFRERTERVPCG